MNDIRDVSTYALPLYRNDYFGAREIMSTAGMPYGMERTLRTTSITPMEIKQVAKSTLVYSGISAHSPPSPPPRRPCTLSDITGEKIIKNQTNLNDLNRRMAAFIVANLSGDNPPIARQSITTLVREFIEDKRYINVTAQDIFSALAFFVSDIDNWNGVNQEINIPDWAVHFLIEAQKEIIICGKDIHLQLEGNHHSRKFARLTEMMNDHDYDAALSVETTMPQRQLMLKAGELYLSSTFGTGDSDHIVLGIMTFHDTVTQHLMAKLSREVAFAAKEKMDLTLSDDEVRNIITNDRYYRMFNQRTEKLKDDLLSCSVCHI